MAENLNQPTAGLNTDSVITQVNPGQLTYALNAMVEGFDGNSVTYQNEQGNILCVSFPDGYKVIGVKNITSLNTVYYFLTNPTTGFSQIGYSTLNSCVYNVLLDDSTLGSDLLNFNISYPIRKVEVKTTNCSTQMYWTDVFNPRRYLDLNNLPWKEALSGGVFVPQIGQIDADILLVQPNFAVPIVTCADINIGGILVEGTYQFAIQYADVLSNGYTSYYSVTNEVRIFLDHKMSPNFNEVTPKAIDVSISNLDTTSLYEYFNLAVIKTINAITSVELVGTYYITGNTYRLTYTGEEQSGTNIALTIDDILQRAEYYDIAGDLTQVDNHLVWANLIKEDDLCYQSIWSQVPVKWEVGELTYNQEEGYTNGVNCANFQGYMRDEVYPLEGCFILKNGKMTTRCHIPGRALIPGYDDVAVVNADTNGIAVPTWEVYNTATASGLMGYWESEELYPNTPIIWGALANQPIRHHKFPDASLAPIHDQNPNAPGTDAYNNYVHTIYPLGFNIDVNLLWNAIQTSTLLTQAQKDEIVGFKLMRGDRINNASIVAKGLFYNVGEYTTNSTTYYYPNYPFNDQNPDPFISSQPVGYKSGDNAGNRLKTFHQDRFTFHSPDTSFFRPTGIQGSNVNMEAAYYGNCKSHFVPVLNNAGQKLRTVKDLEIALAGAVASIVGMTGTYEDATQVGSVDTDTTTIGFAPSFHAENFFPAFNNVLEIIDKLIPYVNYGWQYNGVGFYGNYQFTEQGNKVRAINYGGYINSGLQGSFGDVNPINNTFRESSVYVSLNSVLAPTESLPGVPTDDSRVIASQVGLCGSSSAFFRNISSYYGSIKRDLIGQWGQIFSYKPIDTGVYCTFYDSTGSLISSIPTVFGGDIFINRFALKRKHSFYLKSSVNRPDGTDIDYNQNPDPVITTQSISQTGNVGYPIWYYSTSNIPLNVNNGPLNAAVTNFVNTLPTTFLGVLATVLTGGLNILVEGLILLVVLIADGILTSLGIKEINLDCPNSDGLHEEGQAYLYAYGIPYFFVESEVNVDMRQATNILEGNFFPEVGTDIPDFWLQETNVPIAFDNIYTYNKTYSKENKETYFPTLRLDWTPDNPCFTNFNNRAIWSDKSNLEETLNHWLIYKPANLWDFPKSYGALQNVDSLRNNEVLVRFQDKTQKYNAQTTLQVSQGPAAYIGNTQMFAAPPVDLIHSDTGRAGSQNAMLLKTDAGNIFTDAKRGGVFMLGQQQSYFDAGVQDLSGKGMQKWFYQNLPFQILNYFPTVPTDNAFNGIGITGVYDGYFNRFILTKKDYIPLPNMGVQYDGTFYYVNQLIVPPNEIDEIVTVPGTMTCCPDGYYYVGKGKCCPSVALCTNDSKRDAIQCAPTFVSTNMPAPDFTVKTIIEVGDPRFFCNKSWTISYSFTTKSWVSFHSYIPDFYVQYYSHFQSGRNDLGNSWDHDYSQVTFNYFYNQIQPYVLEFPYAYKQQDEILQAIKDFTTVRKYIDYLTFYEPEETIYFNKSIIYNGQQCTGILNLVPRPLNNLSLYRTFPHYLSDGKNIIVTKSDNFYNYNTFWDIVANKSQPIWITGCDMNETDKDLNQANMNYANTSYKKAQIRAKDVKIRHILDDEYTVRLISKFIINNTVQSFK